MLILRSEQSRKCFGNSKTEMFSVDQETVKLQGPYVDVKVRGTEKCEKL